MLQRIVFATILSISAAAVAMPAWAVNIAVIDVARVLSASNANKRAEAQLEKAKTKAKKSLKAIKDPLVAKERKLGERRSILTQDQFLEEQAKLRKEIRQYKEEEQSQLEKLQREALKHRKRIAEAVTEVVNAMAKENKYDVVLPQNVLLYSTESINISDAVLKRVNARLDK